MDISIFIEAAGRVCDVSAVCLVHVAGHISSEEMFIKFVVGHALIMGLCTSITSLACAATSLASVDLASYPAASSF